jgi:hypothetical protein
MNKLEKLFIENVNGSSIISLDVETIPKLSGGKSNPDQGHITKETSGCNVMVFQNRNSNAYQNMVNKRLAQEGKSADFTVGPRTWGNRIKNTPFVEHKGEMYLEVICLKPGTSVFKRDGVVVDKSSVQGLADDAEGAVQGGLDNKVIIRTFKFASIKAVTINSQRYTF